MLSCVVAAVKLLGENIGPLLWKPHPMTTQLPDSLYPDLSLFASKLGFTEVPTESDAIEIALKCRWVVSSPSTVALELLQRGCVCLILDPQGSIADTALNSLPQANVEQYSIRRGLAQFENRAEYQRLLTEAHGSIGPAVSLNLNRPY